jgi:hypothetical protein
VANWYCSREAVKRAANIHGSLLNAQVDRVIEAVSRQIDSLTHTNFIPRTETRLYYWPQRSRAWVLWLDNWLLSLTALQTKAQDSSPVTISPSDYFLEPNGEWPDGRNRYDRIEIDLSSTASFEAGDTPQRSISVEGSWGYTDATRPAGTVSSGLASDATATSMVCSDASLINVGDTLLIESEQLFVSDRSFAALGNILINGALTASKSEVTVTVDANHGIKAGEVIRVDSEQMYVEAVSGNDLTVTRAYDGTVLASHADNTAVHINRTLTVERGLNGTTAATHADGTSVSVYEPPFDVTRWALAEALATIALEQSMYGRTIGPDAGAQEWSGRALSGLRKQMVALYRRTRMAGV